MGSAKGMCVFLTGGVVLVYLLSIFIFFLSSFFSKAVNLPLYYLPHIFTIWSILNGWAGIGVGAAAYAGGFLVLNLYLIRREAKEISLNPIRSSLPTFALLFATLLMSVWFSWFFMLPYSIRFYSLGYVVFYYLLNLLGLFCVTISLARTVKKCLEESQKLGEPILMVYNFFTAAVALLLSFPYFGELP